MPHRPSRIKAFRFASILAGLFLSLLVNASAFAASPAAEETKSADSTVAEVESLMAVLEDPEQRDMLIQRLRLLAETSVAAETAAEGVSFKTATTELVEAAANRAKALGESVSRLVAVGDDLPTLIEELKTALADPETRHAWLVILGRLFGVLAVGFAAAYLMRLFVNRGRAARFRQALPSLPRRLLRLIAGFLLDLVPIVALALAAYAVLALVDPQQETRLVAVALINASILSRLVLAVSRALLSPEYPLLRLWEISDESANYTHQWVKRLSQIAIYGFFGLQAAVLLGLDEGHYETLLRLLGLVLVSLLFVLIAQTRDDVAQAIVKPVVTDEAEAAGASGSLSSARRGLARIWHLIAGAYLLVVYAIWALQVEDGAAFVGRATLVSILSIALARLLLRGTHHLFEIGLRLSPELRRNYPRLEQRLNRYFPTLQRLVRFVIIVVTSLVIVSAWGINAIDWATEGSGRVIVGALLNILVILAVALVLWEFASGGIERYLADVDSSGRVRSRSARTRTLLTVARNALMVVLTVVASLMVLSEIGINIAPLLAGAGVVGLAIGFGAQRLVQDVINGAFILFQDLMSVGDVVKLGDKAGVVEALSIRTVRLRDLAGVVHTIPFSSIEGVSNLTREYSFHVFDIGIAYRENVDEVIDLIHDIGRELQADSEVGPLVLEPLEVFGLDAFGDSAIVIKGRIKTQPIKQWAVGRAFNRLVKIRFDERDIEIPFPHTTLYFGEDKDGSAPPARLRLDDLLGRGDGGAANEPLS